MKDKTLAMREAQNIGIRKRAELLDRILDQMIRNRIKPNNFTSISEFVAEQITQAEGKRCSATTIRRNKTYRELLQGFMKKMGYENEKQYEVLSNNLLSLQLKVRELEKENAALESNLKSSLAELAECNRHSSNNITRVPSNELSAEISRASNIIYRMMQVLDAFEVDLSIGEVVDTVTMGKVFTLDEFPEFFKWYEENIALRHSHGQ